MRRAVPSFTVEVRRRPKRATTSKPDAQLSEARSPRAGFDRASHRVATAAFEAEKADPSLVEVHRLQRAEFFPASSPTSRYGGRSQTPHQHPQSLTHLRGRQSDRRCGRRSCPGTRDSCLTRSRWLRMCLPSDVKHPAHNQMKGQASRQWSRRPCKQRQSEETLSRSLATTSGPSLCLTTNDPR